MRTGRWTRRGWLAGAAVLGILAASPAEAQNRQGWWGSILGGPASGAFGCSGCQSTGREAGFSGLLTVGKTPSRRVLVGGELGIWWTERADPDVNAIRSVNLISYDLTVTVYPRATSRFFVRGGLGVATLDNELAAKGSTITYKLGTGISTTAAAGYDGRITDNLSLTVGVTTSYAYLGDLRVLNDVLARRSAFNMVAISLGFTWH